MSLNVGPVFWPSGTLLMSKYRFSDWPMSSHFCRRAAQAISHLESISNAVRKISFRSSGMRSSGITEPSWYLRLLTMSSSHKPRSLSCSTRYSFTTTKSPERFDLAYRFLYVGSIDWLTPVMFAIVAVGAMAMVLLFRMPCFFSEARTGSQSSCALRSMVRWPPRSFSSSSSVSMGNSPRSHLLPA